MTPEKLLENLYAIAYALPEQERRFFCALEPAIDPCGGDTINAGHQLALLVRAIRTDMAQQYRRDDQRRTRDAALRRIGRASASKQGKIRPHFAGAFLDEQGRQCVTDGFLLIRLNTPSNVLGTHAQRSPRIRSHPRTPEQRRGHCHADAPHGGRSPR